MFVVAQRGAAAAAAALIPLCVMAVVLIPAIAGLWKVFEKAGKPGWAAIIPIYNLWVMVEISSKEVLWFVLGLVPVINVIASIVILIDIAERFGKGTGFGILLILLPFIGFPMLGFGDAQYQG